MIRMSKARQNVEVPAFMSDYLLHFWEKTLRNVRNHGNPGRRLQPGKTVFRMGLQRLKGL